MHFLSCASIRCFEHELIFLDFCHIRKRMFKMELTDGFSTVPALEYTSIPILTTKLTPGTKLIINGPVRCVNHILFLEAKNVRVLGGEITNLVIENAYENVLRKKLNQPINPNPKIDYEGTQQTRTIYLPFDIFKNNLIVLLHRCNHRR